MHSFAARAGGTFWRRAGSSQPAVQAANDPSRSTDRAGFTPGDAGSAGGHSCECLDIVAMEIVAGADTIHLLPTVSTMSMLSMRVPENRDTTACPGSWRWLNQVCKITSIRKLFLLVAKL